MKKKLSTAPVAATKTNPTTKPTPAASPATARCPATKAPAPAKAAPAKPAAAAPVPVAKPPAKPVASASAPKPGPAKPVGSASQPSAKPTVKKALAGPTTIVALVDVGWGNRVFLRGEGGELSWEFGLPMECRGANEWVWVSTSGAPLHTFKFVLNDLFWEHCFIIYMGSNEIFTGLPVF